MRARGRCALVCAEGAGALGIARTTMVPLMLAAVAQVPGRRRRDPGSACARAAAPSPPSRKDTALDKCCHRRLWSVRRSVRYARFQCQGSHLCWACATCLPRLTSCQHPPIAASIHCPYRPPPSTARMRACVGPMVRWSTGVPTMPCTLVVVYFRNKYGTYFKCLPDVSRRYMKKQLLM